MNKIVGEIYDFACVCADCGIGVGKLSDFHFSFVLLRCPLTKAKKIEKISISEKQFSLL